MRRNHWHNLATPPPLASISSSSSVALSVRICLQEVEKEEKSRQTRGNSTSTSTVCDVMCERKSLRLLSSKIEGLSKKGTLCSDSEKVFAFLLSLLQLARCLQLEIYFLLVILRKRLVS